MSKHEPIPEGKDPLLWEIARKRVGFKNHLISYIIINVFLWALWYFIAARRGISLSNYNPWPMWVTIGWGIGLAFNFAGAYIFPKQNSIENEYEKLKKKNQSS